MKAVWEKEMLCLAKTCVKFSCYIQRCDRENSVWGLRDVHSIINHTCMSFKIGGERSNPAASGPMGFMYLIVALSLHHGKA
jgi:hypothetical protein